jgi:hypothetical protein
MIAFHTNQNVTEVASRIDFAKVRSIDAANRRISLELSAFGIRPPTKERTAPAESPFKVESEEKEKPAAKDESPFKVEK